MSEDGRTRAALISMPFAPYQLPSIQLGILKSALTGAGVEAVEHCLYLDFFLLMKQYGYNVIYNSQLPGLLSEWFFSPVPFDPEDPITKATAVVRIKQFASSTGLKFEDFMKIKTRLAPAFIDTFSENTNWGIYGAVCFTMSYAQINSSFCLARRIKEKYPHVRTIFGGASSQIHEKSVPAYMKAYPFIDLFVIGDGEPAIGPAVMHRENSGSLDDVPGIFYREGGEIKYTGGVSVLEDMDSSPVPDYSGFFFRRKMMEPAHRIFLKKDIPIELSRGCPWGSKKPCTFCAFYPCGGYRPKSKEKILDEIKKQTDNLRARSFYVVDAGVTGKVIRESFPHIKSVNPSVTIPFIETRTVLKKDDLRIMKEAGVTLIQPGIECLDGELLKKVNKGVSLFNNLLYMKWARELGIRLSYNIILNLPDGEPAEIKNQLRIMKLIPHLDPPFPAFLSLVRFSGYMTQWNRYFDKEPRPDPFYTYVHPAEINPDDAAFEYTAVSRAAGDKTQSLYRETLDYIQRWQGLWSGISRPPFLHYMKAGRRIIIEDGRKTPENPEKITLEGAGAAAMPLMQDCPATFEHLWNKVRAIHTESDREAFTSLLSDLCTKGIVLKDGELYLSLATKKTL